MKTAIFIQDGVTQLVLTPETEWEKTTVKMLAEGEQVLSVKRGSFYECRGGYVRHEVGAYAGEFDRSESRDDSLILRVTRAGS